MPGNGALVFQKSLGSPMPCMFTYRVRSKSGLACLCNSSVKKG